MCSEAKQVVPDAPPNRCRQLAAAGLLILVWAAAVFVVQEYTTGSNYPLPAAKAVGSRAVRCVLDVLACGTVVLLLKGWLLHFALMGYAIGLSVLIVYYEYFGRALSWTTITNHFDEGMAVGGYAVDLLRWQTLLATALAALILWVLARRVNRISIPRRQRINLCALCAVGYVLVAVVSTHYIDAIGKLKTFATVDRLAMTNGYLLTWYGEWRHLNGEALLARAIEAARITSDRLTPMEVSLSPSDDVVIIQVESLDFDVVGFEVDDRLVMPFLRNLSQRSMRYRIAAIHRSGSCDADFSMLMNLNPAGDVTPYAVPHFDFGRSIASLARTAGYRSVFLHGNDRSFFGRGSAIDRMQFDETLFREDLEASHGLTSSHWGISDKDLFAVSRSLINSHPGRALHFIITLTSHGPYHFVEAPDCELFPTPRGKREHYLNSMRYVDTQLRTYIESLPDQTLVVIYGDHSSHVDYGQGQFGEDREYVPFFVHRIGSDLAPLQRTRDRSIAVSGTLTTLDAAGYVWSFFMPPEPR